MTPNAEAESSGTARQGIETSAPRFDVLGQHDPVIHLVDVVTGQHEHEAGRLHAQDVEVLVQGIRRAGVPAFPQPLLGGEDVDEFLQGGIQEVPPTLQVLDQAVGLVLGGNPDPADAGIDAVAEREVDDAVLAPNGTAGLDRQSVSCCSRDPRPPARITA